MCEVNLTVDTYFDIEFQQKYMSASQFKSFMRCPANTIAEINGKWIRPNNPVFKQGHYVEESLFGDVDKFINNNPDMFSTRGKTKGELKSEYKKINNAVRVAQNDMFFMGYLTGEHQVIKTGVIAGVPFKIMMDTYTDKRIVDLKAMASFKGSSGLSFVEKYGYDTQGAIYTEIDGLNKPFYLAIITKEDYPNKMILEIEDEFLEYALTKVEEYAPKFQAIKDGILKADRCEICNYCKSTKKLKKVTKFSEFILKENY